MKERYQAVFGVTVDNPDFILGRLILEYQAVDFQAAVSIATSVKDVVGIDGTTCELRAIAKLEEEVNNANLS